MISLCSRPTCSLLRLSSDEHMLSLRNRASRSQWLGHKSPRPTTERHYYTTIRSFDGGLPHYQPGQNLLARTQRER